MTADSADTLTTIHESFWIRTTQLIHLQKLCKIINIYCYFKPLCLRIICHVAIDNKYITDMLITNCLCVFSRQVMSDSLQPHRLWHTSLPAPHHLPELSKFMSIELVMPSNHLILYHSLLLWPSIFASIRVFSNEQLRLLTSGGQSIVSSASVLPMSIQGWFPLELADLISLLSEGPSRVLSSTSVQKHQFFSALPSFLSSSHIHT